MNLIVAVDQKWGIGKNNQLLTHLSGDLKYFKEKTTGKVVVMGRKTFESLPNKKALPKRVNVILTQRGFDTEENAIICHSYEEMSEKLNLFLSEDLFIIGGGQIYTALYQRCTLAFITKIEGDFDADTFIPNLDIEPNWEIIWESDVQEENELKYRWLIYRNNKVANDDKSL